MLMEVPPVPMLTTAVMMTEQQKWPPIVVMRAPMKKDNEAVFGMDEEKEKEEQ